AAGKPRLARRLAVKMHRRASRHWRAVRRCDARHQTNAVISSAGTKLVPERRKLIVHPRLSGSRFAPGYKPMKRLLAILVTLTPIPLLAELPTPTLPAPFIAVDLAIGDS